LGQRPPQSLDFSFDLMRITLNGEPHDVPGPLSLGDLLGRFELDPRKVAIERNLAIVPRSAYGETALADGDRLEIVHFIGGG
jgi:thiamine biosynthesis protein ThiS